MGVANIHTLKPIDAAGIAKLAGAAKFWWSPGGGPPDYRRARQRGGGGGRRSLEPVRIKRHGIPDVFGESGTPEALYQHFKLDAAGIAEVARKFVG